mmetsp:Transcript_29731/g.74798  ORF Transcript_29731/g.74798 Transcript_29731/m.74798 type:complete len:367 (+) Transcript_29731:259-1359(+)
MEAAVDIGEKFIARSRALATDGFIVYDIQDEAGRTQDARPFPFMKTLDPAEYGALLQRRSGKGTVIYKCVVEADNQTFDHWLDNAISRHDHRCFNLVGGASSSVSYTGPTMPDAAEKVLSRSAAFGCVTIAERHAKKGTEHTSLLRKSEMGAKWFISQAIYDTAATVKLLHEYGALCRYKNVPPVKVILTFAPCGREKTMKFIKWLGVHVPAEVETKILGGSPEERKERSKEQNVKESVNILCDCLRTILAATGSAGVPLGVSVESVSIFREEIDAAHDLFTKLQAIMLDSNGAPWKVKWVYAVFSTAEERAIRVAHAATSAAPELQAPATLTRKRTKVAEISLSENQIVQVLLALAVGFLIGAHR